ncbi:MAG: FAD-dependent tricarballylate dehydrogenase TcuA [Pseudolabrys sp.]
MNAIDRPIERFDVIVVGTGLAGHAAALSAREQGANVLVIDKAPETSMGGNTRFSGGALRTPSDSVSADDLINELQQMSGGRANPRLSRILYQEASDALEWMRGHGVTILHAEEERPDFKGSKMPWHAKGNGYGLIASLYPNLKSKGINVRFETKALDLIVASDGSISGVRVRGKNGETSLLGTVILASGNFQANVEMRTRYLGKGADALIVRGSRYNTGDGLNMAIAAGAQSTGNWSDFHSAVLDFRSAAVECGETNINTYPQTVMVNIEGNRFVDEGLDFFDTTYVTYGKAILDQPGGRAFCLFDAKAAERGLVYGLREDFAPLQFGSLRRLAEAMGIDANGLEKTIADYNAAIGPEEFDPDKRDGKATRGLTPPKSNWALPLDTPPYFVLPVTGGITFAFGGLKTDDRCRVLDTEDRVMPNLYAAGEIMGGLFYQKYPGGASLVRSLVFGRLAGRNAATAAKKSKQPQAANQ